MDQKITLSFNKEVIKAGKEYAKSQGISLSRLTEILLRKLTSKDYRNIEDYPIADWVNTLSEGEVQYLNKGRSNADLRKDYRTKK